MKQEPLTIEKIEIYQSCIRLKEPFVLSLEALVAAENILVIIRTDKGITGYGECSPFKTINGETMETATVVARCIAPILIGKNPLEINQRIMDMDRIIYGNSSIKSAFDIALHDVSAKYYGMPLYKYLGGISDRKLYTDYTVSLGEAEKMANDALKIAKAGFRVIKVKLGQSADADIERIRLIREKTGNQIPLRIDANQGWDFRSALKVLKALEPFNIQFCEEPIPRWDFMELPALRKESPVPIMADESCCDHHDAKLLIAISACDYFNIKLGKSSGIHNAMKIIRLAEEAGIKLQVGGFLESRLGFTASAHLALASNQVEFCDFDTPLMFESDPISGGIIYSADGEVMVPDQPGLGVEVNTEYLGKLKREFFC